MRILVVDDEELLVKGIRFNLENEGYEVITGSDGQQAIDLAKSEKPDLIVLDLMMPNVDGLQACQEIRQFSDVPVIMLSAKSEDMDKLEDVLRRAAVACYAAEGIYPPDLEYLQERYGVQIDEKRYVVDYMAIADNLMPDITILEK